MKKAPGAARYMSIFIKIAVSGSLSVNILNTCKNKNIIICKVKYKRIF